MVRWSYFLRTIINRFRKSLAKKVLRFLPYADISKFTIRTINLKKNGIQIYIMRFNETNFFLSKSVDLRG
jgi:hypothetical protein